MITAQADAYKKLLAPDRIVWLHYFCAAGDWWVIEYDPITTEAFGFVRLAGFTEGAEWGYVFIGELERLSATGILGGQRVPGLVIVERDLDWTPRRLGDIKME